MSNEAGKSRGRTSEALLTAAPCGTVAARMTTWVSTLLALAGGGAGLIAEQRQFMGSEFHGLFIFLAVAEHFSNNIHTRKTHRSSLWITRNCGNDMSNLTGGES